jgi:DnaJ-class molecular chaperone
MTGHTPAPHTPERICSNCHGFATAAVSSGGRDTSGHLHTITVDCPACHGHGTVLAPARQLAGGAA